MPELSDVKIKISSESDTKGIDDAEKKLGQFSDSAVSASKAVMVGFTAMSAAVVGAVGFGTKIAGDLEAARQGFVALLGSADKADATMARIKKEAAATPFELTGLVKGTQALAAITKDGDKAIDMLLDVGKAVAVSGKGQADLDRVVLNLQQISSTGKVTAMDIRQFQGAIPIFNDIVTSAGMTIDQLQNADNAAELLGLAFKAAGEKGGIAAEGFTAQAGTFNQLWSNLQDSITITSAELVKQTGIFDMVKNGVLAVTNAISAMATPENIARIKGFFQFFKDNPGLLASFAAVLLTLMAPALITTATAAFTAAAALIAATWPVLLLIALATAIYLAWNNNFLGIRDIVASVVAWITTAFNNFVAFFQLVWQGIQMAIQNFVLWFQTVLVPALTLAFQIASFPFVLLWDLAVLVFAAISAVMQAFLGWIGATFGPTFNAAMTWIKNILTDVQKFFSTIWTAITNLLKTFGDWLSKTFNPIIEGAFTWIKNALTGLKSWWDNIWNGIHNTVVGIANGILNTVKGMINGVIDFFNKLINGANSVGEKVPGFIKIPTIPHLASGVQNFAGGWALVGENGPEIVNLPRGSSVIPNGEVSQAGGASVQVVQNIYGDVDMDLALRQLAYAVAAS